MIRAVSQGGIQLGFHAEEAQMIAAQTAKGAASILIVSGNHPEREIDKVTTPRGLTITGLNEMEHNGLSSSLIKGIITSYKEIENLKK
jgi:pyrroline-5-carboxylate reductase